MTHQIVVNGGEFAFSCDEDTTVLEAGIRAGVLLPHSCRDGACGVCKGKLVRGDVRHASYAPTALTPEDIDEGYALLCRARALSDLELSVRGVTRADDIPVKRMPARVQSIDRLADDIIVLRLKLPASETFNFRAGQYIDILLADGARRAFSIASAPYESGELELHVRLVPGGRFTTHVFESMKVKEILRFEGPLGTFFLRDTGRPIVMLAGGTGFAPIQSLVEQMIHDSISTRRVHVYVGARDLAGLYRDERARQWAEQFDWLTYVPVLSEPNADWAGRLGLVHHAVMADLPALADFDVYACGSPAMIDAARADFVARCGLPIDAFHADAFTFSNPITT